jgi:hypothetical protein
LKPVKSVFKKHFALKLVAAIIVCMAFSTLAYSQAEVMPWGNITGIRKSGQLFEFESSLKMIPVDGQRTVSTAKEHQTPHWE